MFYYFKASFDREGRVAGIPGPSSIKGRYVTEDVTYNINPCIPVCKSLPYHHLRGYRRRCGTDLIWGF